MAALKYVGGAPITSRHLISQRYITNDLLAVNLTQLEIDALVNTGFATYATQAYVTAHDLPNATKAYIDTADDTRLHLSQIGASNGVAGLEATGRADLARVPIISTQRWPKPFWSPAAYNGSAIPATAETTVYTCAVADPGFVYKLLVFGMVDGKVSTDNGEWPVVNVRLGSTSGTIIASGAGIAESYVGGSVSLSYTAPGGYTYTIPLGTTAIDVVALGAGGGGEGGGTFLFLPNDGNGGGAGGWNGVTLVPGSNIPPNLTTLAISVGAGGIGGDGSPFAFGGDGGVGAASSMTASGYGTLTAAGGAAGSGDGNASYVGAGPSSYLFNTRWYAGGIGADYWGAAGQPPGGGGAGGFGGLILGGGNGGAGASGAVFVIASSPSIAGDVSNHGPVRVMPAPISVQSPLTGAITLYLRVTRSGSSTTATATTFQPSLYVVPVPA